MYLSCFHRLPVWFRVLNTLINIMYTNVKYLYLPEKLGVTFVKGCQYSGYGLH